MGSSSTHSSNHTRYSSPRGGISPYGTPYADRRSNSYHSDSRGSMMSDRESTEESNPQRKRIAVACMRCRKRKIRCTGDSGNGQPCLNCKNAGFEPCQFLRVSSHETHLKNEQFTYSLEVARNFQARGSSVVPPIPTTPLPSPYPEPMSMPSGEALPYRNSSASTYAYGNKYYPLSGWSNGYTDDNSIDYSVYQQSYPPQHDAAYMVGYRMGSNPPSNKPSGGSTPLYIEPETAYGYPAGPSAAAATTMVHRPAPVPEANTGFAYHGIASLPSERLLPTPSSRPMTSAPQQHPYRAESISSAYSKTSQSSTGSSSPAALSEAATTYASFENSPLSSYPTPTTTNSHLRSEYTTSANPSLDAIMAPSEEPPRMTAPEMQYKYIDTTRRYASTYTGNLGGYSMASSHGHSGYSMGGDENDRKAGMRT
ncbi:hypothetical protein CFAM422_004447 [Trichoderma lentiforme]|uniref:Zn(2)-C6 fungal-type domain-containing protein n=1 Tax=Trichoderma lentiforme TaxID=1567552 RepID=A0A9P5CGH6_9HYPO|nr:hypothetical protein CFAM422_004447 [Trichoderma lentiforme]